MQSQGKKLLAVSMIFAVALVYRLIYIHQFSQYPIFSSLDIDQEYYHFWAKRIAAGDLMSGTEVFEMTPLYAYMLGFFYKFISTDIFTLKVAQSVAGSISAVMIFFLAGRVFKSFAIAVVAGGMAAMYAPFVHYDNMVMKSFLTVFFSVASLIFLYRGEERGSLLDALFAGASIGLLALVRENAILLIAGVVIWFIFRFPAREAAKSSGVFLAGFFLVMSPVAIRNYVVSGDIVLNTAGGGEVFYIGNNPEADGTYKAPPFLKTLHPFKEHEEFRSEAQRLTGRVLTRKESSDFWFGQGLDFIKANPGQFTWLVYRKFVMFWNFYERPDNLNFYFMKTLASSLNYGITYGVLAPLGILGIFLSLRDWRKNSLLYIFLLTYLASMLLVFNFARFRIPIVPVIMLWAAFSLVWFYHKAAVRDWKKVGAAIGVLALLFIGVNCRFDGVRPYTDFFDTEYHKMGKAYLQLDRLKEARENYEALIRVNPSNVFGYAGLARVAMKENRNEDAVAELEKGLGVEPQNAGLYMLLATAYNNLGQTEKAQGALNVAFRLGQGG
ncbi:MAG: glycosyltransferase family 39 protein [Deltaproteobacteria bacterium]